MSTDTEPTGTRRSLIHVPRTGPNTLPAIQSSNPLAKAVAKALAKRPVDVVRRGIAIVSKIELYQEDNPAWDVILFSRGITKVLAIELSFEIDAFVIDCLCDTFEPIPKNCKSLKLPRYTWNHRSRVWTRN